MFLIIFRQEFVSINVGNIDKYGYNNGYNSRNGNRINHAQNCVNIGNSSNSGVSNTIQRAREMVENFENSSYNNSPTRYTSKGQLQNDLVTTLTQQNQYNNNARSQNNRNQLAQIANIKDYNAQNFQPLTQQQSNKNLFSKSHSAIKLPPVSTKLW